MNQKEWNKLKPHQRFSVLYDNDMRYYIYANASSSWGKLTEYVQNLLSQINLSEVVL